MGTFLETNDIEGLRAALKLACQWLVDTAQIKTETLTCEKNKASHPTSYWKGAIRGEYSVAKKQWSFFCPMWHTGQAIKSLVMAYNVLNDRNLLEAAMFSAGFIEANRISDPESSDFGLILAYEDFPDLVNTSAVLETLDGLLMLSETTGDKKYQEWALEALSWVISKMYIHGEGLFRDWYDPKDQMVVENNALSHSFPGRPNIDDSVLLKAYELTGDEDYKRVFYEIAERLLREEDPPGTWVAFGPSNPIKGSIHPRQSFWWGRPMLSAYKDSGDHRYLSCFMRSGEWYAGAQRKDGGIFRATYENFKTESFGHQTSATACAALVYLDLYKQTHDQKWVSLLMRGMRYCMKMQLLKPNDPNLKGAIIEKINKPDGTDDNPYHIRDLGTIFFIQAASAVIAEHL